jgi:hypothetical protein
MVHYEPDRLTTGLHFRSHDPQVGVNVARAGEPLRHRWITSPET